MDIPRATRKRTARRVGVATAALAFVLLIVALTRVRPTAPSIDRSSLIIDSVRRGEVLREVRAQGNLVPEHIRWITAQASARVERLLAQSGQRVAANDVLLELSNPDVQIQTMQAQQQVRQAQIELINLRTGLQNQQLAQEAAVASTRTQYISAAQEAAAADSLLKDRFISKFDAINKQAQAREMTTRLRIEQERLALMRQAAGAQITVQRAQVAQLSAIAAYQQRRLFALQVRAPEAGVLQDLSLQLGQWVPEGTTLAKVVQPGKLKAVLRIFESQAKDIQIGQSASIDTRNGFIAGNVSRKDPAAQAGTVTIDVALDGRLPPGAVPDVAVTGTIQVEKLQNVLYTSRPSVSGNAGEIGLFKLVDGGNAAIRIPVVLGRSSVNTVEIVRGLQVGDRVIVSDMSSYDNVNRVRIK